MKININNYTSELNKVINKLQEQRGRGGELVEESINEVLSKITKLKQQADQLKENNDILKIGIVGQVKAGKSSFINSLFFNGDNVLPKASTPMTAGLTILEYDEENKFEVEYYNTAEWQPFEDKSKVYLQLYQQAKSEPEFTEERFRQEIDVELKQAYELVSNVNRQTVSQYIKETAKTDVVKFSDQKDRQGISNYEELQGNLEKYVGANGQFTSIVKCLRICLRDERLKGLQVVDTPGVNDPVISRECRTQEFLKSCHGVFLLSSSSQFFSKTDVAFLEERIGDEGIKSVVLLGSKFDSALQDAGMDFEDDLGGAIDYCKKSLKNQFERNISNSSYKGNRPILDFSSGIGFSIATKAESAWDPTEKHVVARMKQFYPSFFATSSDIKDVFGNLSQMDKMRKDYLDKIFVQNKDSIMQEKVDGFLDGITNQLTDTMDSQKKKIENSLKALDVDDFKGLERGMKGLIEKIEKNVGHIVTMVTTQSENYFKECVRKIENKWDESISIKTKHLKMLRMPRPFGYNLDICLEVDDTQKLLKTLMRLYGNVVDDVDTLWQSKNKELMEYLKKEISAVINKASENDKENNIDSESMIFILDEVIVSMMGKMLPVNDLKDKFKNDIMPILSKSECCDMGGGIFDIFASKPNIEDRMKSFKMEVVSCINENFETMNVELKQKLRECIGESVGIITQRKSEFIEQVKDDTKEYLENLKNDINNKSQSERVYKETLSLYDELIANL